MQTVYRDGHSSAKKSQALDRRTFRRLQPMIQGLPRDVLHDQIGHVFQVPGGHKARHMGAGQHLHDLVLDLKADDVLGTVARRHARNFHGQRKAGVARTFGVMHVIDVRHAARMDALLDGEAVELGAGLEQLHRPNSSRSANKAGKAACRIATAAEWWS